MRRNSRELKSMLRCPHVLLSVVRMGFLIIAYDHFCLVVCRAFLLIVTAGGGRHFIIGRTLLVKLPLTPRRPSSLLEV